MRYFKLEDFACPCCGGNEINLQFIEQLDMARAHSGIPFVINSGWRCEKHNAEVGGVIHSAHRFGHAVDLKATTEGTRFFATKGLFMAGFQRIRIGDTFIHVDNDPILLAQTGPGLGLYPPKKEA